MECKEALPLLHEYLDGGLEGKDSVRLKEHLLVCAGCRSRLQQFEKVEALVHAWSTPAVPEGLTERVMQALPPAKRRNAFYRFVRKHPAASVAAIFALVMLSSFVSTWSNDRELLVKGTDLQSVVIKGDTVIVPAGRKVAGDLTVENGKLQVDGEVEGNVTIIDGTVNYASTAHISGQITQIDEAFSWMWYKMNTWFAQVSEAR
ncbi:Transmembrane transcriptional regulator (anti-sigma factor RsiW) [Paenibacillus sp. UNCCL117]|uniref:zf-HC2 domain-containing protein n=1 Tax=unclassified Paenibacillus TaxID=185978 RepID=UPI00088DF513|nr:MULTISPECIES: zf-HC2 domain-containing protein [unclassified Paenibacillus]SDE12082.1 Transmembrane transcriptional regulator (anti-sigma factor RsiW) [Paenibacillus sp. cl123]SFW60110.1 Transmembrane transcriptional regulator (anti-sigma factor RsiW) [Paenibacillus sp. UNCCL117]